jgi:5'-3' exonuclease
MSILCDSNQFLIGSLINQQQYDSIDVDYVINKYINVLQNYSAHFYNYGSVILCFDNNNYWRKDVFFYYKYSRKEERKKSTIDWTRIFNEINLIKQSLRSSQYSMIEVDGAEADDIIAVISKQEAINNINTMIISGDKDFVQLLKYPTVSIYNSQKNILLKGEFCENYFL